VLLERSLGGLRQIARGLLWRDLETGAYRKLDSIEAEAGDEVTQLGQALLGPW